MKAVHIMRRMQISLQRENARSVVRRLADVASQRPTAYPEGWADNEEPVEAAVGEWQ